MVKDGRFSRGDLKPSTPAATWLLVAFAAIYVVMIPLEAFTATAGFSFTFFAGAALFGTWLLYLLSNSGHTSRDLSWDIRRTAPIWVCVSLFVIYILLTLSHTDLDDYATDRIRMIFSAAVLLAPLSVAIAQSGDLLIRLFIAPSLALSVLTLANLNGQDQVAVADLNANGQAYLLTLAGVWSIWFAMRANSRLRTVGYLCSALLCVAGVLGTGSRTGAITLAICLPIAVVMAGRERMTVRMSIIWTACVSLATLAVWVVIRPLLPTRLDYLSSAFEAGDTWSGRTLLWSGALEQSSSWLWFGVGVGQSPLLVATYFGKAQVLHNTALSVAVELGLVGLLLFVSIGIASFVTARRGVHWGVFSVALFPTLLFMSTLSMEYYKVIWFLPAVAAGGCVISQGEPPTKVDSSAPPFVRRRIGPSEFAS